MILDKETLKFLLQLPPDKLIKRFISLSIGKCYKILGIENRRKTKIPLDYNFPELKHSFINNNSLDTSKLNKDELEHILDKYLNHKFDLLGSGWVSYGYPSRPMGIEGIVFETPTFCNLPKEELLEHIVPEAFVKKSTNTWALLDNDYSPIDWNRDHKSGYRWNSKEQSKLLRKGLPIGADLKMPWELSRMQFLPQLAVFAIASPEYKDRIIREYKNIVLDFIATNVPDFGVNWVCTMDVAIRATNILVANDMLVQLDDKDILDKNFRDVLNKSIFEHGWHIVNNLEYSEIITSNHYLSNVCGLLFISAYFESNEFVNTWLPFAVQEILKEMPKQFYADGGNFEGSTSYHRLSSEMLIYSYALMTKVIEIKNAIFKKSKKAKWNFNPKVSWKQVDKLPQKMNHSQIIDLLHKTGIFLIENMNFSDEPTQFGDNDSGRFLKFSPTGTLISNMEAENKYLNLQGYIKSNNLDKNDLFFDENILNHASLAAAYSGFFNDLRFEKFGLNYPLEKSILNAIVGKQINHTLTVKPENISYNTEKVSNLKYSKEFIYKFDRKIDIKNIRHTLFPDFGICLFKSKEDDLFLSIFFGSNGHNGLGGHSHNDKLSFELVFNEERVFFDPGTYLYTPLPDKRNKFRSVFSHNVPIHNNEEQGIFQEGRKGIFRLFSNHKCKILNISDNNIAIMMKYRKIEHVREFVFSEGHVTINDSSNVPFVQNFYSCGEYSNGYGKLQ
jgi:hypothetical protein